PLGRVTWLLPAVMVAGGFMVNRLPSARPSVPPPGKMKVALPAPRCTGTPPCVWTRLPEGGPTITVPMPSILAMDAVLPGGNMRLGRSSSATCIFVVHLEPLG